MLPEVLTPEVDWPPEGEVPTVLLVGEQMAADRAIVERWLSVPPLAALENDGSAVAWSAAEAVELANGRDAWIAPLRVAWLPSGTDGDRRWRLRDLARMRGRSGPPPRERERILAEGPLGAGS